MTLLDEPSAGLPSLALLAARPSLTRVNTIVLACPNKDAAIASMSLSPIAPKTSVIGPRQNSSRNALSARAPAGFAPIAIGLGLTLIHLIGIPVTNLSVNPARSTGPALFVRGWALDQLWVFWVAPLFGALLAGFIYPALAEEPKEAIRKHPQAASKLA